MFGLGNKTEFYYKSAIFPLAFKCQKCENMIFIWLEIWDKGEVSKSYHVSFTVLFSQNMGTLFWGWNDS